MLEIDPISSEGTRDIAISLAGDLETGETISSVTVTSGNETVLGITNVAVNVAPISYKNVTAAIGEAVLFRITGLLAGACWRGEITLDFTGNQGSKDCYRIRINVKDKLTE